MTNEQLEKIYSEGSTKSHIEGLRAVYEAGVTPLENRVVALESGQVLYEVEDEK